MSSTEDTIGSSSRGSDRDILSSIMTDEEAPIAIEEAIVPPASNGSSATAAVFTCKGDRKLSAVSKQYDIDGDGELDEAEQAMRNMDTTGRGYLTNDKVYALMVEQMNLQKSVFQMKKVIIGLLVFVVILALSNLGTSFASAILAKDSTTNDKNELVSTKTGDTIATEEAVARFEAKEGPIKTSTRYLNGVSGETATYTASSSDFTTIETTKAHELLKWCYKKNKDVIVAVNWANGNVTPRTVCSHTWSCETSVFRDISGSQPTSATLCLENSDQVLWIQPVPGNPDLYTISGTELSSFAGEEDGRVAGAAGPTNVDFLTGDTGDSCTANDDCDDHLLCMDFVTAVDGTDVGTCKTCENPDETLTCECGDILTKDPNTCAFERCPTYACIESLCSTGDSRDSTCCGCPADPTSQDDCARGWMFDYEAGNTCIEAIHGDAVLISDPAPCEQPGPDDQVCAGGVTYGSACWASISGQDSFTAGACTEDV